MAPCSVTLSEGLTEEAKEVEAHSGTLDPVKSRCVDVVDVARFLEATRDSGYRHLEAAVAEIIDNALQAGARRIRIATPNNDSPDAPDDPWIGILDDGCGMSPYTLARALQFGGSERFNNRHGIGRYGMGLPNSSLSQARRVEVYSWQDRRAVWRTELDLDSLLAGGTYAKLEEPVRTQLPVDYRNCRFRTGTLVIWRKLDRTHRTARRRTTISRRLHRFLGQTFRYYLWRGIELTIDNEPVTPIDPLFLKPDRLSGMLQATPYGPVLRYAVRISSEDSYDVPNLSPATATIEVQFSELPIDSLADLPNAEKRSLGITGRAGISIVRAGREIDYGWYLLNKRRENYDDWWRCEIRFPPALDEMFGVTHIKQGIRPSEELRQLLATDLTEVARSLHRRVRVTHLNLAATRTQRMSSLAAAKGNAFLRPLNTGGQPGNVVSHLPLPGDVATPRVEVAQQENGCRYRISLAETWERDFCKVERKEDEVVLTLNTQHEFFRTVYSPLLSRAGRDERSIREGLEMFLLALGRSLFLNWTQDERATIDAFLGQWSRAVAVFCRVSEGGRV